MHELLNRRFPSLAGKVEGLLETDETLRELCEDLEACENAALRLEKAENSSPELRGEYAALRLRLEHELLRHLEETGAMTGDGGASVRPRTEH